MQDLSRFMYTRFKESMTHVPKLERKLSEAERNLAAAITEAEGSKAKLIVEMEKMRQEQVSREKDILDTIDRLAEKLTKREKEFKDEMDKLEKDITYYYLEQVEEQNQRLFKKGFTKGNEGGMREAIASGVRKGMRRATMSGVPTQKYFKSGLRIRCCSKLKLLQKVKLPELRSIVAPRNF